MPDDKNQPDNTVSTANSDSPAADAATAAKRCPADIRIVLPGLEQELTVVFTPGPETVVKVPLGKYNNVE